MIHRNFFCKFLLSASLCIAAAAGFCRAATAAGASPLNVLEKDQLDALKKSTGIDAVELMRALRAGKQPPEDQPAIEKYPYQTLFSLAAKSCPVARRNLYLLYLNTRDCDKARELQKQLADDDLPPIPGEK